MPLLSLTYTRLGGNSRELFAFSGEDVSFSITGSLDESRSGGTTFAFQNHLSIRWTSGPIDNVVVEVAMQEGTLPMGEGRGLRGAAIGRYSRE